MKSFFLNCYVILLIGQVNVFGLKLCRTDDVNPLTLLNPSVTIKANVYFGSEDEDKLPIAKTDFYLLDKSLVKILKDSGFKPEILDAKQSLLEDEDYLTATAKAFFSEDEESTLVAFSIKREISKHKLFTVKTNRSGQAHVKAIKTGNYYLFGVGKIEDDVFVWHLPVEIKSGGNFIEIDQHNAEVVFSIND